MIKYFKINVLLTLALIMPCVAFTQIQLEIYTNYGISNFKEKNNEFSVVMGNYYTSLPSYSIGVEMLLPIKDSKLGAKSALAFSSFAAENHMPDDFVDPYYTGPRSWDERFYAISVPLKLNYKFENWLHINAGLSNTIILNEPKEIFIHKINRYTLNISSGVDFIIKKRFVVGLMYFRDIIPIMVSLIEPSKPDTWDIKYSVEQITLKIGYVLIND